MSAAKRQQAKDLIKLALDENTSDNERVASALRAVKIIAKYDLLSSPLDLLGGENETVQAARSVLEVLTDPNLAKNVKKVADRFRRR